MTNGSRLAGFKIDSPAAVMAGDGTEGSGEAVLEDLEIAGADRFAVVFGEGSRAVLRGSYLHDNREVAVLVDARAFPRLLHNVITGNGKAPAGGVRVPDSTGPRLPPAVVLQEGASAVFFGNVIAGNAEDQVWGLAADKRADLLRDNVIGLPAPPHGATPAPRRK